MPASAVAAAAAAEACAEGAPPESAWATPRHARARPTKELLKHIEGIIHAKVPVSAAAKCLAMEVEAAAWVPAAGLSMLAEVTGLLARLPCPSIIVSSLLWI